MNILLCCRRCLCRCRWHCAIKHWIFQMEFIALDNLIHLTEGEDSEPLKCMYTLRLYTLYVYILLSCIQDFVVHNYCEVLFERAIVMCDYNIVGAIAYLGMQ